MMTFMQFVAEGGYPAWVKVSVGAMVLRVRNLAAQIERETDPVKQNKLLAQQSKLLAYMAGLGVAVSTGDLQLGSKIKGNFS
jgi:heme exporter protein D